MTGTPPQQGPRRRPRVRGEDRDRLRENLAARYEDGVSIRGLAAEYGRSYGLTRTLLVEAGATLRSRQYRSGKAPRQ